MSFTYTASDSVGPTGAITSAATTVLTLTHANQVVDLIAGVVAIIAGITAIAWTYYQWKNRKN